MNNTEHPFEEEPPESRSFLKRAFLFLFQVIFFLFLLGGIASAVLGYLYYQKEIAPSLPDVRVLKDYQPNVVSKLFDDEHHLVSKFYIEKRIWLDRHDIPPLFKKATIAVEDSNFYQHGGIDYIGILRAAITNYLAGHYVQGGSTITQQLAKTFFLSPEKKIKRKIKELFIAFDIEKNFTKEEILSLYLNQIYYGSGAYGIEAASQVYFGKHASELNLAEIATIAGIPKAPSHYSPLKDKKRSYKRRLHVLRRMAEVGFITKKEAREAGRQKLRLSRASQKEQAAPYYVEHIRRDLAERYGTEKLYKDGLLIYSSLNSGMQKMAQIAIKKGLRALDKRIGYRGANVPLEKWEEKPYPGLQVLEARVEKVSKQEAAVRIYGRIPAILKLKHNRWARTPDPSRNTRYGRQDDLRKVLHADDKIFVSVLNDTTRPIEVALEQEPNTEASLLSIDVQSGEVKAMVGGYDFHRSQFNRAIQAKRQLGSAIKPIIYATAISKGYGPASMFLDAPIIIGDWKPENYEKKFYGPTLLRTALKKSRNVVTIKLLQEIGFTPVVHFARSLGITSDIKKDLSIALGSSTISLFELTRAYSVFARGGKYKEPSFIRYIENRKGKVIEDNRNRPEEQVIEPETAYIIANMMQSVIRSGTGVRVKKLHPYLAGKTGTTNDYIDAWFMGYTPDVVTGVWTGYDTFTTMGKGETGARAALPIWKEFMSYALPHYPVRDFPPADHLEYTYIDKTNGLLATPDNPNGMMEIFKEGTSPTEFSSGNNETHPLELH